MKMHILKTAFLSSFLVMTSTIGYRLTGETQESSGYANCSAKMSELVAMDSERLLPACQGECGQVLGQCLRGCAQLPLADAEICRTECRDAHAECLTACTTESAEENL
jgi:hypothetical protein